MRGDHPRQTLQLWSGLVDLYLYLKLHLSEQTTKSPLAAWIVGLYCPAVGAVTEQALLAVANAKHAAAVALTSSNRRAAVAPAWPTHALAGVSQLSSSPLGSASAWLAA